MRTLFFLLDWIANPLYILLGVVVIWFLYRLLQVRNEISATYFELEREIARRRQANILTVIIIAIEIAILLVGVQVRAVPFLEAERSLDSIEVAVANATQDVPFFTDTPEPLGASGLDLPAAPSLGENDDIIVLTPTLTPTPVGTIVPNAPPVQGCNDPRAQLQIPANGQRVFTTTPILVRGTAFTDNFSEAKVEISGPGTLGQFIVVGDVNTPIRENTELIQFNAAPYSEGAYQFRLMVFDITTQLVASCQVTVYISDPPVAATPTPSGG